MVPGMEAESPLELLEAKDVARLFCVPLSWVREETRRDRLPHVHLGPHYVRYQPSVLCEWLSTRASHPSSALGKAASGSGAHAR